MRALSRDERGATAVVAALAATVMIGFTALAVDTGYLFLQSRRLQGTADLAAVAAAQDPSRASRLAEQTIADNKWPGSDFTLKLGVYTADRSIPPKDRFVPRNSGANAVAVEVTAPAELFFGRLLTPDGKVMLKRRAIAAQTRWAALQVGSRLASLNGGVANSVLSGLTGSKVSLSVADYRSLANADVDLLSYVGALRTRMNVEAATFDQTLSHNVDSATALGAISDVLRANGLSGASSMDSLAAASGGRNISGLKNSIDLGPYRSSTEVSTGTTSFRVSALDLATGMLVLAGQDRQVRLDVGSSIPGIADIDVWLAVGEPPNNSPWISITDASDMIVRTAQMRLYVEAQTSGVVGNLAALRIPIFLEVASAQAKLSDISCDYAGKSDVTLSVAPSLGELALTEIDKGRLDNFKSKMPITSARLLKTGLVQIDGKADLHLGGENWQSVRFSKSDIASGAVKTVRTNNIAGATVSSLLGNTQLTISALGLGISTPALKDSVGDALGKAAAGLDPIINSVTGVLGVGLGEADVRVNGVRCGGGALVM